MNHNEKVALFRDQLRPGVRMRCARNERVPARVGLRVVVGDKIGMWSFPVIVEGDPSDRVDPGSTYWLRFPDRARDLIEATPQRITYWVAPDQLVEWEIIPEGKSGAMQCDQNDDCSADVTHIDDKGYVYCTEHGLDRRAVRPCRKLRDWEVKRLEAGLTLVRY